MVISYKKLWKLLIDKDMKKKDLAAAANISTYTVNKLNRGENVNTANRNKWLKPHIPSNNLYDVLRLKTVEECHANLPSKMILARYFYAITKMCVSSITG